MWIGIQHSTRILVVDDETDIGKIVKKAMERDDSFAVDIFADPHEALEQFRAGTYDLALIDIRMPEMDGMELFRKMKGIDGELKACFITAFEADRVMENKQNYPDLETVCIIRKPILMKDLMETVKRQLLE